MVLVIIILVAWAIAAYLLIPWVSKLYYRHHFDEGPRITLTSDGHPGDPVNVAIEGEAKESARAMVAEEKLASEVGALTRELETIKASRQKTKEKLAELDVAILQVKLKLATVEREKAILVSALISAKADHGLTLAEDVDALLSPRRRAEDDTTTPVPRSPATNTAWASGIPGDGDE